MADTTVVPAMTQTSQGDGHSTEEAFARRMVSEPVTRRLLAMVVLSAAVSACGPTAATPPAPVPTTYRILGGVSMGAVGTSVLGLTRPERFDGLGMMGGPLDAALFIRMADQFGFAGFCSREDLEALMATDAGLLNSKVAIDACAKRGKPLPFERAQTFNQLAYTTSGDDFDRTLTLSLLTDLTLGFGNFMTYTPVSKIAPPGVEPSWLVNPPANFCSNPTRIQKMFNKEYNPTGQYDAITFCDGQPTLYFCTQGRTPVDFCADKANIDNPLPPSGEQAYAAAFCASRGGVVTASVSTQPLYMLDHAGAVDPCRQARVPVRVLLAYDYNGNGRRDYGEPLVNNGQERFSDTGVDGCADAFEDGKGGCLSNASSVGDPNGDNFEGLTAPHGTEGNYLREAGEKFADDGLDGVPGTGDFGEGNGTFDLSPGRLRLLEVSGRARLEKLEPSVFARLAFLFDGGVRDVFNLGLGADWLFGKLKSLRATATRYRDFLEIPGTADRTSGAYDPFHANWKQIPRDLHVLYGKDNPTDADRVAGEGDHVGTDAQALHRFFTFFSWAAATWPNLSRPVAPYAEFGTESRQRIEWYESTLLGAKREYAIALPPGYYEPSNAEARYPVVYLLHGYGQEAESLLATMLLTDAFTSDDKARFRPMIYVFPSGRCCFRNPQTGARDCRERSDDGARLQFQPEWKRECIRGNFFLNQEGKGPTDSTPYGDAVFELMDQIDSKYRTLKAADVAQR